AVEHLVHEFRHHRYDQDEHFSGVKQTLKTATYSACFGMSERNLVRFGNPGSLGPKDRAQRRAGLPFLRHVFGAESAEEVGRVFVTHRVIAELLRARRARMEAVIAEGGLTDVFGRSYALGDEIDGRRVTVRTCLAAEMQ